jgi:hypothetical protein
MDRPLREHISFLETRVQELSKQLMEDRRTQAERNRFESELRAAQLALNYYREALKLEKQLSGN